jgi:hypothetical protein
MKTAHDPMKSSRRPSPWLALALAVLAAPQAPLAAQEAAAAEQLPAAREVLDRFATVAKIREAVEKTSSLHATGKFSMEAMKIEGPTEIWSAKPDLRLVSVEMGAFGKMLTGYDGQVAWMTHPMMGARILEGTELLQLKLEAPYDGALKPDASYESMRTVGRESFEDKDCWKLELVARPLEGMEAEKTRAVRTSFEFYEISTGLLIGTQGRQEGEMGGGPYTSVFSDYREFGGQLMAGKTVVRQSGQEIVLTIESVEYDTASETTFAPPREIQTMLAARAAKKPQ